MDVEARTKATKLLYRPVKRLGTVMRLAHLTRRAVEGRRDVLEGLAAVVRDGAPPSEAVLGHSWAGRVWHRYLRVVPERYRTLFAGVLLAERPRGPRVPVMARPLEGRVKYLRGRLSRGPGNLDDLAVLVCSVLQRWEAQRLLSWFRSEGPERFRPRPLPFRHPKWVRWWLYRSLCRAMSDEKLQDFMQRLEFFIQYGGGFWDGREGSGRTASGGVGSEEPD